MESRAVWTVVMGSHAMPFDGSEYWPAHVRKQVNKLDRAIGLLSTEDRWLKGDLSDNEGRRCILAALIAADAKDLIPDILRAVKEVTGRTYVRVEYFNDDKPTTYRDVCAVLERTRQNLLGVPQPAHHGFLARFARSATALYARCLFL